MGRLDKLQALTEKAAGSLKTLFESSQLSEVKELLNYLAAELPAVKESLVLHGEEVAKVAPLEAKVKQLTKALADIEAAAAASQGRVLLGELAFAMDKAASAYVLGAGQQGAGPQGAGQQQQAQPQRGAAQQQQQGASQQQQRARLLEAPFTVNGLKKLAKADRLGPEQLARWDRLVQFLNQRGWDLVDFLVVSQALKDLRHADAHSTPGVKASVTLQQLQQYADKEAKWCIDFVNLAALFGRPGQPLVPVADVGAVLSL